MGEREGEREGAGEGSTRHFMDWPPHVGLEWYLPLV